MQNSLPRWATSESPTNPHMETILNYAFTTGNQHLDWFVRHKETGIKTLVALLSAEFAIAGVHFSGRLPAGLAIPAEIILGFLAIALTRLAVKTCSRAYLAWLEHVVLTHKAVWAMGLAESVNVAPASDNSPTCPVRDDESFFIPRYVSSSANARTTTEFVQRHLRARGNTLFTAKRTLLVLCIIAVLGATSLVGAMWVMGQTTKRPRATIESALMFKDQENLTARQPCGASLRCPLSV